MLSDVPTMLLDAQRSLPRSQSYQVSTMLYEVPIMLSESSTMLDALTSQNWMMAFHQCVCVQC